MDYSIKGSPIVPYMEERVCITPKSTSEVRFTLM